MGLLDCLWCPRVSFCKETVGVGPKNECIGVSSMTKKTLTPVPCPVCGAGVDGVIVEEESEQFVVIENPVAPFRIRKFVGHRLHDCRKA